MADDDKKQGPGISSNSFIVAALVASGAYYFYAAAPLQVSRPMVNEPQIHERFGGEDVESRLWQDPFAAIAKAIEKGHESHKINCNDVLSGINSKESKETFSHEAAHCQSPLVNDDGKIREDAIVLGVTVSGAPYYEDGETRRRLRYAVLSGLHAEGYSPVDEQHLGYFRPATDKKKPLPEFIPFEWFENAKAPPVLVLWIDEDELARKGELSEQISRLREALCSQHPEQENGPSDYCEVALQIVGPNGSRVFEAITRDLATKANSSHNPSNGLCFYASGATISKADINEAGPRCGDTIFRTIAQDDALARAIADELRRRQVEPGKIAERYSGCLGDESEKCLDRQHVALISDRDTIYGRGIVTAFARALKCYDGAITDNVCAASIETKKLPYWIHPRTYLRGMDGALPPTESGADKSTKKSGDKDAKQSAREWEDSRTLERPFGQGQFDYLRRLARSLKNEDEQLRRDGEGGIRAIGVLGNDVFDKLQALRALKPLFPEAVFFTTDYDSALAAPNELEWTRNLIVASSYGPVLAGDLQSDIPPFRSVYQASAFLATRLAISEATKKGPDPELRKRISKGLDHDSVRLFEIDRKGDFFPLPTKPFEYKKTSQAGNNEKSIHPQIPKLYPKLGSAARLGLVALLVLVAAAISWNYWKSVRSSFLGLGRAWYAVIIVLIVAAVIVIFWEEIGKWATKDGMGKPIAWSQGVSAWPAIALRAIGAILAVGLIFDGWDHLKKNLVKIRDDFGLTKEKEDVPGRAGDEGKKAQEPSPSNAGAIQAGETSDEKKAQGLLSIFEKMLSYHLPFEPNEHKAATPVEVGAVWKVYEARSQPDAQCARIAVGVILTTLFFILLAVIYGWPSVFWRGDELRWTYFLTTYLLLLSTAILVLLVLDASLLCLSFVEVLRHNNTRWPTKTQGAPPFEGLKMSDRLLDEWIDLTFIAKRTRCIGKLIYYPFAILALMIVSRSAVFDDFPFSTPILITQIVAFVIIFGCALTLGFSAEKARNTTKKKLTEGIIRAKAADAKSADASGASASQLENLLKLVDDLREGSFVPLSQQPPIRALLLPLGGIGWTALLDYRLLPGL